MNWFQKMAVIFLVLGLVQVLAGLGAGLLLRVLAWCTLRPMAPAVYVGWQDDFQGGGFALYNLTADIEGHPAGSTVSERTLRAAGYRVPFEWRVLSGLGGAR